MKSLYLKRPDCRLYYEIRGEGPLMVMVHGVACDADYFKETAALLSEYYTVVTYDRRGYSRSSAPAGEDYSLKTQAQDLVALIEEMDAGKAILTASSAGSVIAVEAAASRPDLLRSMLLHEPAFAQNAATGEEWGVLIKNLFACREKHRITKAMLLFIEAMGGQDERAKAMPLTMQEQNLKNLELFVTYELDDLLSSPMDAAKSVSCPVTVMAGEGDGEGLFCRTAKAAAGELGWPILHVPGFHNLAQDLPYDFAVQVLGALALTSH